MYEFDFSEPLELRMDSDGDFWLTQPSTDSACLLDTYGDSSFREKEREYNLIAPTAVLLDVLPYDEGLSDPTTSIATTDDLVQNVNEAIHAARYKIAEEPCIGALLRDHGSEDKYVRLATSEDAHWMRVGIIPSYHYWDDIKDKSLERVNNPVQD